MNSLKDFWSNHQYIALFTISLIIIFVIIVIMLYKKNNSSTQNLDEKYLKDIESMKDEHSYLKNMYNDLLSNHRNLITQYSDLKSLQMKFIEQQKNKQVDIPEHNIQLQDEPYSNLETENENEGKCVVESGDDIDSDSDDEIIIDLNDIKISDLE